MTTSFFELSAVARDAFVVLSGAEEIKYRDGDAWKLEDGAREHPLVHRLRAASLASMTQDPEDVAGVSASDAELEKLIRNERVANENMREFLVEIEEICLAAGMPKTVVGREVLAWMKSNLATR